MNREDQNLYKELFKGINFYNRNTLCETQTEFETEEERKQALEDYKRKAFPEDYKGEEE